MRVLFHIPRATLTAALKTYDEEAAGEDEEELEELMETLRLIEQTERVPDFKLEWPVSFEDACSVVSNLHDQLDQAHDQITELQKQLYEMSLTKSPPSVKSVCPDCGALGEVAGHQTCQYPQDH